MKVSLITGEVAEIERYVTNPNLAQDLIGSPVIGFLSRDAEDDCLSIAMPVRSIFDGTLTGIDPNREAHFTVCNGDTWFQCHYVATLKFPYDKGDIAIKAIREASENIPDDITWKDLAEAIMSRSERFKNGTIKPN